MPSATRARVTAEVTGALRVSVMRLARRLRLERASEDLTLNQLAVLGNLERSGDLTVGELAALERVKPPSMTRTVNNLVEAGLVERRAHETDGRQVVVALTDTARAVLAEDRRRRDQWLAQRLAQLDEAEIDALDAVLPILDRLARS